MEKTRHPRGSTRGKTSIVRRRSKVHLADFARLPRDFGWYSKLSQMIPQILRGKDLEDLAEAIVSARRRRRPVIAMMGAHVVKCGLGGLLAELIRREVLTGIAMNGACAIHDAEIAMWGKTSEDVADGLVTGLFGTARETAELFNAAAQACLTERKGLGAGLGELLLERRVPNEAVSLLATASRVGIKATVHVAIGTDVVHQHPEANGEAIGYASMADFRKFAAQIAALRGGVVLNLGSAVVMPEVFLKALAMARNRGGRLGRFTTANFDMLQHYRPLVNVIERPRLVGATTYNFTGNHELVLPVLVASIMSRI